MPTTEEDTHTLTGKQKHAYMYSVEEKGGQAVYIQKNAPLVLLWAWTLSSTIIPDALKI